MPTATVIANSDRTFSLNDVLDAFAAAGFPDHDAAIIAALLEEVALTTCRCPDENVEGTWAWCWLHQRLHQDGRVFG